MSIITTIYSFHFVFVEVSVEFQQKQIEMKMKVIVFTFEILNNIFLKKQSKINVIHNIEIDFFLKKCFFTFRFFSVNYENKMKDKKGS